MDKYHTRRAIMTALKDCEPAPAEISDILTHPTIEMAGLALPLVRGELQAMAEHGYVTDLRPGRSPLFRLTGVGRDQINREGTLHEFIWGEFASEFA